MAPTHTSELLEELVAKAPDGPVDLEWLLGHLDKRSFGLLLLLLGLLVIIPGVATIATLALLFPAVEMMLGRTAPWFPSFLSKRQFDFKRFKQFTVRARPLLKAIESVSRPRWNARHDVINRLVGLVVFLLALSAGWPLPLVNVIPGIAVVLIAIAYLQEDGLLLTIGMVAALICLLGLGWTLWTSVGALIGWIGL
ncbi:exopolysaccharide biosynthesis protein [Bradyrhizobium genosp. P]|uniref:exopolysaccharide biosynthesis protein n=1 Tax=Bradyrhizobium genosp. P TaxID=83641 RepID=UPI003CF96913